MYKFLETFYFTHQMDPIKGNKLRPFQLIFVIEISKIKIIIVWLKLPGLGHILLIQWISGEILHHFDIKPIYVSQKLTELEIF